MLLMLQSYIKNKLHVLQHYYKIITKAKNKFL